jgi:hypothetical protein
MPRLAGKPLRFRHCLLQALSAGVVPCLIASAAHAVPTPEQRCQSDRYKAGARYSSCVLKTLAKHASGLDYYKFAALLGRCHTRYTGEWAKIQARAAGTGSKCDAPRFIADGLTVLDNLTGLQWEQKTADGTIHDRDDVYSLSLGGWQMGGTAFTSFLPTLNAGACFSNHCDWRLPTLAELWTIVTAPYPGCESEACTDPIFGASVGGQYWTTTVLASNDSSAWYVQFSVALPGDEGKLNVNYARAVRAGL